MKLVKAEVRNFRSISHLTVHPAKITTFIGKNSCGKSNILRALQFFFTASAKSAIPEDICHFADDGGTWVECTFGDLSVNEIEQLTKYVKHDGTIKVRRTLYREGDRCFTELHGYVEAPTEPWLQDGYEDYADMDKWRDLRIDVGQYATVGTRGKLTKDGFKEFQQRYVAANADSLQFAESLSESEFKGRQSTAAAILPHFIFVPAVGDIVPVIYGKQSSLLNEMVSAVIETGKTLPDYTQAQASLQAAQEFVNPSTRRLPKLERIEADLAGRLGSWPGTVVTIRTEVDDLADILVAGLVLGLNDGYDTPLSEKGDGIQRQVLFRVFQLYADFRAKRGVFTPEAGEPAPDRGPSIIAFEEPELFLHPQAQEQFYDDLVTVSARDQVLLATHSSFLLRLEHADGLHVVRRPSNRDSTKVHKAARGWLDAGDRQRVKEINLCSGEVSKVFFADRVVITEGPEDVIYILGTARDHANCLDRRVTVVQVGGKPNIPALQRVLNAFAIPYTVACDRDPGNPSSAGHSLRIEALAAEANASQAGMARVEHFDPDVGHECHGAPPPGGEKPFNALAFFRDGAPTPAFADRVRALFTV